MLFLQSLHSYLSIFNFFYSPSVSVLPIDVSQSMTYEIKVHHNSTFFPLLPPSIPLAVRSPYVNVWLSSGGYLTSSCHRWPRGTQFQVGWNGLIKINSVVYQFLGDVISEKDADDIGTKKFAKQISFTYTSTSSIFLMEAGGVQFEVTFLSPVNAFDLKSLSLPLSYMEIKIDPKVLRKNTISVYADINGQWASGDSDAQIEWSYDVESAVGQYQVRRKEELEFVEHSEFIEHGSAIHAIRLTPQVSTQSGPAQDIRSHFVRKGKLNGTQDVDYRRINDRQVVFAFAKELTKEDSTAVFTVGHMRTNYISYITRQGQIPLKGLWTRYFSSSREAVVFFVNEFLSALAEALVFDAKVRRDARLASGSNYSAIVELSTRQSFATFELTEYSEGNGAIMAFLKEISSNGDCSTVDVIFPMHPILLYTNPTLLKYLLEPLMVYSASGMYPHSWTVHDLGTYPVAHGYNLGDDEAMPIEEAGNMLWMILAYLQLTNDTPWVSKYYPLLTQWTTFLIQDGLIPASQLSTDDFAGTLSNQTNLAVKAIVGIGAMSHLAKATNHFTDFIHYDATARAYAREWYDLALDAKDVKRPHAKLNYQDNDSWGLLYNLFGDRILNLKLFDDQLYEYQSEFYPSKLERYGVPLDSRHRWSKTDWEMYASASATSVETRDMFIDALFAYLKAGKVDAALPDLYETETGDYPGRDGREWNIEFIARPVVGGHFSLLALQVANKANGVRRDPFRKRRFNMLYFSKDV